MSIALVLVKVKEAASRIALFDYEDASIGDMFSIDQDSTDVYYHGVEDGETRFARRILQEIRQELKEAGL